MGLWIRVLVFVFTIWNPAVLALQAASTVSELSLRSPASIAFLAARLAVTGIGVAAGIALWVKRPGAVWLAKAALVLFAAEAVARFSSRVDVSNVAPGMRLPFAVFVVLHNTAWYLYLQISRRVRSTYGLESQL